MGSLRRKTASHPAHSESMWLPIETAPKMKTIILFAITDTETRNWKMETGYWMDGYGLDPGGWVWGSRRIKVYEQQPTHWMPMPAPPEMGADGEAGSEPNE